MGAFVQGFNFGFGSTMLQGMFNIFGNGFFCRNFFTPNFFFQPFNFNSMPLYTYSAPNFNIFSRPDIGYQQTVPMPEFQFSAPNFTQIQPAFQYNFNINSVFDSYQTPNYNFTVINTPHNTNNYNARPKNTPNKSNHSTRNGSTKYWFEMSDSEMRAIYGDYTRDITDLYTGTAEQLNKYIDKNCGADSVLKGKGAAFIAAQEKYGISASVLLAIAKYESAGGTSDIAINKYNVTSISTGKSGDARWKKYSSVEECINDTARMLKEHYVTNAGKGKHLKKLYQINAKYCPVKETAKNSNWAKNVAFFTDAIERV